MARAARAPKKVAVRSYYYSLTTPEGGRDHAVEDLLARIEGLALPAIRALDGGLEPRELSQEQGAPSVSFGRASRHIIQIHLLRGC